MNLPIKQKQLLVVGRHLSLSALLQKNRRGKTLKHTTPNAPTLLVAHSVNVNGPLKALRRQRRNQTTATR
jgi:hypothetical protein